MKSKAERVEGEFVRIEREMDAEHAAQEQEIDDIKSTYQKLEKKVVNHLQSLRKVLDNQSFERSPMHIA